MIVPRIPCPRCVALVATLALVGCTEPTQSTPPVEPPPAPAPVASFARFSSQSAVVRNPANGHYYQAVSHVPDGILYDDAREEAAERRLSFCRSAHLVTITSRAENDFLTTTFPQAIASPPEYYTAKGRQSYYKYFGFWIGAELVEDAAAPNGFRWSWVTGEPFDFFNWFAEGVPNGFPRETRIHLWANPDGVTDWKVGGWNDAPPYFEFPGYIVEHEGCDPTPPQVEPVVQGSQGADGWYTSDVQLAWTVTDGESPATRVGCDPATVTVDTPLLSFTCTATSLGGTTTRSVTVRRDATRPSIAYTGNAGSYDVTQTVEISCSAWDAVSGLASSSCPSVTRDAYRFNPGVNTLSASARDRAGNATSASTSFTVVVTAKELCKLTKRILADSKRARALCVILEQAAARASSPDRRAALEGYARQVESLAGTELSPEDAAALVRLSAAL